MSNITTTIKPEDIKCESDWNFMSSLWQNSETETSIYYLVKMAQKHKSWRDFTIKEIDKVSKHDFWFNKLRLYNRSEDCGDYDAITYDKKTKLFSFTDKFIIEVFRLSPKK